MLSIWGLFQLQLWKLQLLRDKTKWFRGEGRGKSHFLYYTAFCKLQCNHKQKGWLNHLVHSAHGWRDTAPRGGLFPSHVQTSKVVCNPFCITGTFKDKVSCLKAGSLVEKCTFLCWEAVCVFLLKSQLAGVAYKDLLSSWWCLSYMYNAQQVLIVRPTSFSYIDISFNIQLYASKGFSILNVDLISNFSTINIFAYGNVCWI